MDGPWNGTQLNLGPEGVVYVDTVYDGLGRVYQQTNPHRSSPSSTDGITTHDYDALGRETKSLSRRQHCDYRLQPVSRRYSNGSRR